MTPEVVVLSYQFLPKHTLEALPIFNSIACGISQHLLVGLRMRVFVTSEASDFHPN